MRRGGQGCEVEIKGIGAQKRETIVEKGGRCCGGESVEKKWTWTEKKTWHMRAKAKRWNRGREGEDGIIGVLRRRGE